MTADLMAECFQHANVDGSLIAPSVLDEMSSIPEHVALMAKLDYICCGGGMLVLEGESLLANATKVRLPSQQRRRSAVMQTSTA